jgi:hypothetical protein
MIFYTIQGPGHRLEFHDTHIQLVKRGWLKFITTQEAPLRWELSDLSQFEITIPKYLFWGKLEWQSFGGHAGNFRFSTNGVMVKKIELYMQKKIIKNHQNFLEASKAPRKDKLHSKNKQVQIAA